MDLVRQHVHYELHKYDGGVKGAYQAYCPTTPHHGSKNNGEGVSNCLHLTTPYPGEISAAPL